MPLSNPYPKTVGSRDHKLTARVSHEDFFYLENLFSLVTGLQDKVGSILYKKLVDELRSRGLRRGFDTADCQEHPSIVLLESLLANVNFNPPPPAKKGRKK